MPTATRPRLGCISFLHRFGSALNRHVHLYACVTNGVFVPAADGAGGEWRFEEPPPDAQAAPPRSTSCSSAGRPSPKCH
ncbi:MAG: transposase [Planctomycetia bacterium]